MTDFSGSTSSSVAASTIGEGESRVVDASGLSILICRSGGELFAVENRCTHAQSRLEGGRIRNGAITCPLHGARFDLGSGRCKQAALGYAPLRTFPVREVDGRLELELS